MECHHCGLPGHKKYDCPHSNCRCRWGEKLPARRPPISHRGSLELQGQHNAVNTQRNHGSTGKYIQKLEEMYNYEGIRAYLIVLCFFTSLEINGGHLSLPQQYPHNVNGVRFSHVQQGSMHLQQNIAGNVQQHIPGNLQQHVNGNVQQHVTGTLNNASIPLFGQQSNGNSAAAALLDPTLGPLLQSALEAWPLLQHFPQQQQTTQQINNTNLFGSQASNQQAQTFLLQQNAPNLGYVQNTQQAAAQYLQAQLQQLLNASINNVNVNNAVSQAVSTIGSQVPITMTSVQPFVQQIPDVVMSDVVMSRQSTEDINVSSPSLIVPTTTSDPPIKEEVVSDNQEPLERQEMTERIEMPQQEKEEATEQQERRPGETNAEIITKLKALRDKIKNGLHPKIKPPRWVPCNQQENGGQNLLGLSMRERSPAMTGIEHCPNSSIFYRSRRSRSPFNAYKYEKEGTNSDYRRYRNRSRSASPRRNVRNNYVLTGSVSPNRFRTRSITEYDERYYARNPGQEFRDKYPPPMAMYEELRHGRHNERYERPFGRSRSPIGYPGNRRPNNIWHGEPYERERPGHEFHYEFARRRQTSRW
ncbi:19253_t:CDS:2 [Funneliformis geosporum]|uniref:19253_t:CDS:1 n=1 Tax=Funneliformis geosporum TaxID=1117311 RepID=A0A9W4SJN3_9GLOM|nr:19253_t:CDS:2 [Funneliformis geosporum]